MGYMYHSTTIMPNTQAPCGSDNTVLKLINLEMYSVMARVHHCLWQGWIQGEGGVFGVLRDLPLKLNLE